MEFGKLDNVDHINWELPEEDPLTQPFLKGLREKPEKTTFYLGAPAWGRKEWVGSLYPPHTKPVDFLFYYSRNFNCIELNTTHYRIPTPDIVKNWVSKVPKDFIFCPKIPQMISHEAHHRADPSVLLKWFSALENFDAHLGPCFLQLPPSFIYKRKAELFQFLRSWPDEFELMIELRHSTWFDNGHVIPALVEYLQSRNIGLVITDVAGRRDVLHTSISASFAMLRFIGNDLHPSDFERAKAWALRIKQWQDWGLKKFYFMVHEPEDVKTPEMAEWVTEELNQVCTADLTPLQRPLI